MNKPEEKLHQIKSKYSHLKITRSSQDVNVLNGISIDSSTSSRKIDTHTESQEFFIIEGISRDTNIILRFNNFDDLCDILDYYNGFKNVVIPYSKAAIVIDDYLFVLIRIPDLMEGMMEDELGTSLVEEKFIFHYNGKRYYVEIKNGYYPRIEGGFTIKNLIEKMKEDGLSEQEMNAHLGAFLLRKVERKDVKKIRFSRISMSNYAQSYIMIRKFEENNNKQLRSLLKTDGLKMVNSIIFDYCYNHKIVLNPLNIEEERDISEIFFYYLPDEMKPCMKEIRYRPINPILLDLLYIADFTPLPMFKFLCYYQILEYFYDKFIVIDVSNDIREILIKPDFLNQKEYYTEKIFRIVRSGHPRQINDKLKLKKLLERFITEDILSKIENSENLQQFKEDIVLDGGLLLPSIYNKKGIFDYKNLRDRIYTLRCGIVHSNPDFDEKQRPIQYTSDNIDNVSEEAYFLRLIAIEILGKASAYIHDINYNS